MKKYYNSLFWRLSLFFLIMLLGCASIFVYITNSSSMEYAQETSQRLNRSVAKRVAKYTKPFIEGEIDEEEVKLIFYDVMVINPSVEVYLLDNAGKILSFYAPFGEVKLKQLDLKPISTFIENENALVKGEDPRNPGVQKVFSAAKVMNGETQVGYVYIILASQEYTTVSEILANSYNMKLAIKSILVTLFTTLVIGIVVIWFLTKNLNRITQKVNDFKQGDLSARIRLESQGELSDLANNIDSMADTIVEYIDEIKSLENLRKELITNISHDLRTPLTSIQGYAETLTMLDDSLDAESRLKYSNVILSSTHKVRKLVDDLFQISKLESNQIKTKKETFSIREMLSDVMMKYKLIAESKSIRLEFDMKEEDALIFADIALIDRVFQNILDNALKHTQEGEKILLTVKNKDKDFVEVIIKDTGIGIPKDELPYIFDRYKKVKDNTKEGSGLGLAIVKKILELHKIEIFVDSSPNKGTSFSFCLPVVT